MHAYLRLEVRLLRGGQHISRCYVQMEEDLTERGPISRLAIPENPQNTLV